MPLHKNQIIPLDITSLSSDGNGVGRHEGQVVFVAGAAAGDALRVKIAKVQKNLAYGIIHQVVTPGPGRVKPDCPIAKSCGGCAFRHLTYEAELEAKRGFVADALARIGKINFEVPPALPSPLVDRYRNKVQYPVAPGPQGELTYGFYASRSHRVVPCADCLLQPAALNQIAAHMANWLRTAGAPPYNETDGTGLVRHIYLRQNAAGDEVLACLVLAGGRVSASGGFANECEQNTVNPPHAERPQGARGMERSDAAGGKFPNREDFAADLVAAFPQVKTVVLNHNTARTNVILGDETTVIYGSGSIGDSLCGVPVRLDAHSFAQVNPAAAARLFAEAKRLAAPGPGDVLLDLYCGTGVIGLSMAGQCKALIGVETVPQAVEAAKASAAEMGLSNTRFLCGDAGEAAARLRDEGVRPDVAILDPPRKGADAATLAALLEMAPGRIVMVSCNPATLARDLAALVAGGYALQAVQPADMFPRTKHVECVALLTKSKTT